MFLILISPVIAEGTLSAKEDHVVVYFFWANGCPHCANEKPFLEGLKLKYPGLEVKDFEITSSRANVNLLKKVGERLGVDVGGVPFTVVGEHYFIGWYDEETTGKSIEDAVSCTLSDGCYDIVESLITPVTPNPKQNETKIIPEKIKLPILGEVDTKTVSLPVLTILIGGWDGFNPCAMWVLVFLISMLLGMENRKRMWAIGSTFIITSGFVYFLFMSAWLNLFLFLGFIMIIRVIIGLVALCAGYHGLKEYMNYRAGVCKVTSGKRQQNIVDKIKRIIHEESFLLALIGIIALAFAVNLVELICSAGLPAVYTQILALSDMARWQYYAYLLLYIFVFMLDDMIVFIAAMVTMKLVDTTEKYVKFSHLIGGIIMLIIGALLILRPELLMFG